MTEEDVGDLRSGVQQTLGGKEVTTVVNKTNADEYDVDIGRADNGTSHMLNTSVGNPGWLGNPYRMSDGYSREEAVRKFREAFMERLADDSEFREAVDQLHGQTLACYCKPEACHGDVIAEYLNRVGGDGRSPEQGGCWICKSGNGYEDDDDMAFDMEFDTHYHPDCLEEAGVESILEYEQQDG